jgi:hypothetical protein
MGEQTNLRGREAKTELNEAVVSADRSTDAWSPRPQFARPLASGSGGLLSAFARAEGNGSLRRLP